ncbi:hypothetical protein D3C77_772680 [compost metagenome]
MSCSGRFLVLMGEGLQVEQLQKQSIVSLGDFRNSKRILPKLLPLGLVVDGLG